MVEAQHHVTRSRHELTPCGFLRRMSWSAATQSRISGVLLHRLWWRSIPDKRADRVSLPGLSQQSLSTERTSHNRPCLSQQAGSYSQQTGSATKGRVSPSFSLSLSLSLSLSSLNRPGLSQQTVSISTGRTPLLGGDGRSLSRAPRQMSRPKSVRQVQRRRTMPSAGADRG